MPVPAPGVPAAAPLSTGDAAPSTPAGAPAEPPGLASWDEVLAADLGTRPASGMPWHSVSTGGARAASSVEREGWSPLSRWDEAPAVPAPGEAPSGPAGGPDAAARPLPGAGPVGSVSAAAPAGRGRSRVWIVVLVIVALVVGLGGGGVYLLTRDDAATGARAAGSPVLIAAPVDEQGRQTPAERDASPGLPQTGPHGV